MLEPVPSGVTTVIHGYWPFRGQKAGELGPQELSPLRRSRLNCNVQDRRLRKPLRVVPALCRGLQMSSKRGSNDEPRGLNQRYVLEGGCVDVVVASTSRTEAA